MPRARSGAELAVPASEGRAKTFFSYVGGVKRIHSPKSSALKQNSLIFVSCIDYSSCRGEINHPVLFDRIAGFANLNNKKLAACAAKKR
jgi:hypothetical protein